MLLTFSCIKQKSKENSSAEFFMKNTELQGFLVNNRHSTSEICIEKEK